MFYNSPIYHQLSLQQFHDILELAETPHMWSSPSKYSYLWCQSHIPGLGSKLLTLPLSLYMSPEQLIEPRFCSQIQAVSWKVGFIHWEVALKLIRTFKFGQKSMYWGRNTDVKLQGTNAIISVHPTYARPSHALWFKMGGNKPTETEDGFPVFPEWRSRVCDPRCHLMQGRRDSGIRPGRKKGLRRI